MLPQTVPLDWANSHDCPVPQVGDRVRLWAPIIDNERDQRFYEGTVVGYCGQRYSNKRTEHGTRFYLSPIVETDGPNSIRCAMTPNAIEAILTPPPVTSPGAPPEARDKEP